jgi:hypothetical protein
MAVFELHTFFTIAQKPGYRQEGKQWNSSRVSILPGQMSQKSNEKRELKILKNCGWGFTTGRERNKNRKRLSSGNKWSRKILWARKEQSPIRKRNSLFNLKQNWQMCLRTQKCLTSFMAKQANKPYMWQSDGGSTATLKKLL